MKRRVLICTQGEEIKNNAPKRKKDNLPYRGAGKFLQSKAALKTVKRDYTYKYASEPFSKQRSYAKI